EVLYRGNDGHYWAVRATERVEGAPRGFQRFAFAIFKHTVSPGWTATAIQEARIAVIPFLRRYDNSSRLFDHNRMAGDFDTYELNADNGFTVPEAPEACM